VARQLSVALSGMAVSDIEQCSGLVDRKVDRHSLANLVVIHVAAVAAKVACQYRLAPRRSNADASKHRLQRYCEVLQLVGRLREHRDSAFFVQPPRTVETGDVFPIL